MDPEPKVWLLISSDRNIATVQAAAMLAVWHLGPSVVGGRAALPAKHRAEHVHAMPSSRAVEAHIALGVVDGADDGANLIIEAGRANKGMPGRAGNRPRNSNLVPRGISAGDGDFVVKGCRTDGLALPEWEP